MLVVCLLGVCIGYHGKGATENISHEYEDKESARAQWDKMREDIKGRLGK